MHFVLLVLTAGVVATASGSDLFWQTECGKSKYPDAGRDQRKAGEDIYIVNGWEAREYEFPWQAALQRSGSHTCGAVIINPNWLITAAHCVDRTDPSVLTVVIGDHKRSGSNTVRQSIQVAAVEQHEDYDETGEIENDVAVLRVDTAIAFTENIQPACKPSGSYESKSGTTSGWGRTGDMRPLADTLLYANNPIMPHTGCQECFPSPTDILPGMLCFGFCGSNEQSTCNGDSGGPMVVKGSNDRFDVVGLTSWGMGGCLSQYPPVFTNVSYFTGWIDERIKTVTLE